LTIWRDNESIFIYDALSATMAGGIGYGEVAFGK
jgi:hypothetical protein